MRKQRDTRFYSGYAMTPSFNGDVPQPYNAMPLNPQDPAFDRDQNHYWHYHALDALLACKRPVTASQDEDLFIAVHQICELAFHQMILDLERVLDALAIALCNPDDGVIGDTSEACYFLTRVLRLYEVTVSTMPILATMRAFAEFRTSIGPTSGFQSAQFRHLEIMSGVSKYWDGGTNDAAGNPHMAEVAFNQRYGANITTWLTQHQNHSLVHYYTVLLSRVKAKSMADQIAALRAHAWAAPLMDQLQRYDDLQTRFHRAHLGLAVQQLKLVGVDIGTGGTAFRNYLGKYEKELVPLFPGLKA